MKPDHPTSKRAERWFRRIERAANYAILTGCVIGVVWMVLR